MSDRLLGNPPNQITESEKKRRHEDVFAQLRAIVTDADGNWLEPYSQLKAAQHELDRLYPDLPPETGPITVASISALSGACPTQAFGKTADGKEVYVRYRGGYLSVDIDDVEFFGKQMDYGDEDYYSEMLKMWEDEEQAKKSAESHELMKKFNGGFISYDGRIEYEQVKEATEGWLIWPEKEGEEI